jgi:chromosomal replication initiator protein
MTHGWLSSIAISRPIDGREGSMAKNAATAVDASRKTPTDTIAAIRRAIEARIGTERFGVWFGPGVELTLVSGEKGVRGRKARTASSGTAVAGSGDADTANIGTANTGTAETWVGGGDVTLAVSADGEFATDWLRRAFLADVEAAARTVCGPRCRVVWRAKESSQERAGKRPAVTATAPPMPAEPVSRPAVRRPAHTLDGFVVGPSNRMAFGAVELAAARPGELSPLVVHGASGVGKTHLLDGVCGRARERNPGTVVVSLSAEQFTNGFLQALHRGGLPGFRRSCRSADLLVIDDIQFLLGKRATLLEFQLTVDALHRLGRQMVFSCDRELDALPGLGSELLTRLRGGMIARILPPDYDVRRGIVADLCGRRSLAVPDQVVHYVATHMTRHARELIGAVNRLEATSLMLGVPVTVEMAEEALADLVRSSARSVRLADVEQAICRAFGIEDGTLQSSRRSRAVSQPRMLAMFLARKHTHAALADIGRYFGRRSHSTVIAAQRTVGDWLAKRSTIVLADTRWSVEEAIRRVEDVLRTG